MIDGRFPGKIVIFPQLRGLPLTSLEVLAASDPEIAAALGEGGTWTREAEATLFARYWATAGRAVIVTVTPNPSIDRTIEIDRLSGAA